MSSELSGRKVLVTGATGFIGGRLVEKLVLDTGAQVRAFVTGYARAVRIARFDVELATGDLTSPEDVRAAVRGCDVVFHCAYGSRGDAASQRRVNVEGTRHVLEASRDEGVDRVVHVSTVAVYGNPGDGDLDETAPREYSGDVYADSKRDAEEVVEAYAREGVPAVIIQPTVVYGPFGPAWTQRVIERLRSRRVILVDEGQGLCNAVYVDDVVDAMLLAATRPGVEGEAFLISGAEPTTWRDFYRAYEEMLGETSTVSMSWAEARAHAAKGKGQGGSWTDVFRTLVGQPDLRRAVRQAPGGAALGGIGRRIVSGLRARPSNGDTTGRATSEGAKDAGNGGKRPVQRIDSRQADLFRARTRVRIDKAKLVLGYEPQFDLKRGMARTEAWARWAKLLDGGES